MLLDVLVANGKIKKTSSVYMSDVARVSKTWRLLDQHNIEGTA